MRLVTRSFVPRYFLAMSMMAAWQLWVPTANAQQPSPPASAPSSPEQAQPRPDLSDPKLDAAAAALAQVASVKQNYQQQLDAAAEQAEKERIANEANQALVKAVEDQGLTVEEYNSIIVVAQNDPDVRQKILQRLRSGQSGQ